MEVAPTDATLLPAEMSAEMKSEMKTEMSEMSEMASAEMSAGAMWDKVKTEGDKFMKDY